MGWIRDIVKTVEKATQDAVKTVEKAAQDAGKTAEKAVQDAGKTAEKAVQDTGKTVEKAFHDTVKETERAGKNVNDLAISVGHFLENQTQSLGETLSDAEKRVREGKLIDAIWHLATDPVKHTEDNVAEALIESSLLNNIATAAASIYGGPKGAAAYAAWYTYKQTGDLELALKSGIIAGATAQGISMVNGMPSDEIIKKTLASASIGGAAVAASGGDEKAIIEAFVKGGALSAARNKYKEMTKQEIEGRAPTKSAVAKLDPKVKHQYSILLDKEGNPILDSNNNEQINITSMPREISHVGIATNAANTSLVSGAETSTSMQLLAKLPYLNDMAYYHDQWAAIAQMGGVEIVATIVPATILTVTGSDIPIINQATEENIESKK